MSVDRRQFLQATLATTALGALAQGAAAQTAPLFPGFRTQKIQTTGATIHTVIGGSGPPLLLIHGYPQTHAEWHKIAGTLAERFTVVMTDLRGYDDSSKPADTENHATYSKRAMALDQVEVMRTLGFDRFAVVGHDRGARVTWRLAVEHPERISRAVVIDIVPLPYANVTREFATEYYHWFVLIQPAPLPETLLANNAEFFLRSRFQRLSAPDSAFTPQAFAEYLRCFNDPAAIHASCEDYRAGATIDIEHANADGDRKVNCPLLVLWGERGSVGRLYNVMDVWRRHAVNVTGKALPAAHFIPEEMPAETLAATLPFLQARA